MKPEIQSAVKSAYSQYGLKPESIEKIVNAIESRLSAGTIEPENLQTAIKAEVEIYRPFLAVIQSEISSSKVKKSTEPTDPPVLPTPSTPPTDPPADDTPSWAKALLQEVADLKAKDALTAKATERRLLFDAAVSAAKGKGASNDRLLTKAQKLIDLKDGLTIDQIADELLKEYNELQSVISGDSAVPQYSSRQLSDSEIETKRAAVVTKSASEFKKNSTI